MKANKFAISLVGAILVTGVLLPARAQDTKLDPKATYSSIIPNAEVKCHKWGWNLKDSFLALLGIPVE